MLRKCVPGEQFTDFGTCEVCSAGTYLMEVTEAARPCKPCLKAAICQGGNLIAPKDGFWRAHEQAE